MVKAKPQFTYDEQVTFKMEIYYDSAYDTLEDDHLAYVITVKRPGDDGGATTYKWLTADDVKGIFLYMMNKQIDLAERLDNAAQSST